MNFFVIFIFPGERINELYNNSRQYIWTGTKEKEKEKEREKRIIHGE